MSAYRVLTGKISHASETDAGFGQHRHLRGKGRDRVFVWDTALEGFGLILMASGSQSYVVEYRHNGKSPRMSLSAVVDLTTARKKAKAILGEAAQGRDPIGEDRRAREAAKNTLRFVYDEYFAGDGAKLTSSKQQKQDWDQAIRRYVVRLLDQIEDEREPAHNGLAHILNLFSWHASRDDDFRSPIVRAMGRRKARENRAR